MGHHQSWALGFDWYNLLFFIERQLIPCDDVGVDLVIIGHNLFFSVSVFFHFGYGNN